MKKTKLMITLFTCLMATGVLPHSLVHTTHTAAQAEPAYAKWGQLAMLETKKKYPRAQIVDYRYVGHQKLSAARSQETFRLVLREGNEQFAVSVKITYQTPSEKVVNVHIG